MVKSEPKKKLPLGGFFQKFFRKPEKSEKEQRLSVQRSIPYLEMGRDGICRVEEHLYVKVVDVTNGVERDIWYVFFSGVIIEMKTISAQTIKSNLI